MKNIYAFWNNKGGTGKTSLSFQTMCSYANKHSEKRILAIDVCPQANLSELLLGGLMNNGSACLLDLQDRSPRSSIGGYFQQRLSSPYQTPVIDTESFIVTPSLYNDKVPENIDLVCGDPLLELQVNAISTLANNQIPGTDTWIEIVNWLSHFIDATGDEYDIGFIDANPSFSIYTQIALSSAHRLLMPVMADDSSRRAIQNAFSLIFGLSLPSDIYAEHAFATRLDRGGQQLPQAHLLIKNRITQYMGPASAYSAVLQQIVTDIEELLVNNPDKFSFNEIEDGHLDIRDFQTTGVVAFAHGSPFYALRTGLNEMPGRDVQINEEQRTQCIDAIDSIVARL